MLLDFGQITVQHEMDEWIMTMQMLLDFCT
jgi:hypothetical protein